MAFTYQLLEIDALNLYQTLDDTRRSTFYFYQSATKAQDATAADYLKDLSGKLSIATEQLADLKRKIDRLKRESEAGTTA
jgi:hypothetical protein